MIKNRNNIILTVNLLVIVSVAGFFWLENWYGLSFSSNGSQKNIEQQYLWNEQRITDTIAVSSTPVISKEVTTTQPVIVGTKKEEKIKDSNQSKFSIKAPIFIYHYVEPIPPNAKLPGLYIAPADFENQLKELKSLSYNTVFVRDIARSLRANQALPPRTVALSFDDGYLDFYTNVYPLLKKYDMKATFYIIVNALGQSGYLTHAQVKEMANSGYVEIGSHTFNHPDLSIIGYNDAVTEIANSKTDLEQITGLPVETFAYPYGRYKEEYKKIVADAGYLGAVTTLPGAWQSAGNLNGLHRMRPDSRTGEVFANWIKQIEESR